MIATPAQPSSVLNPGLPDAFRSAPNFGPGTATVDCHPDCLISGGPLDICFRAPRFPVLSSVTDKPASEDIFYPLEIGIGRTSGLVQQKFLPPPSVLYAQARNSGVGQIWRRHYHAFADFIRRNALPERPAHLAEIGSGNGYLAGLFLEAASVTCFEPVPTFPARGNLEIIQGFFPDADPSGRRFDGVFASHTFEHINDPQAFLNSIYDQLADGGTVCLSVPNFGVALDEAQVNCFNTEHTLYLTPETFPHVLAYAGFTKCVVEAFENHSLFIKATKRGRHEADAPAASWTRTDSDALRGRIDRYSARLSRSGDALRGLVTQHQGKTRYLFGGHMMSTVVLFLLGIDESEFAGVLDNDSLKDGLRLYGTSLECRRPEAVTPDESVVFLNGGAYHDEIKCQLAARGFEVAEWSISE